MLGKARAKGESDGLKWTIANGRAKDRDWNGSTFIKWHHSQGDIIFSVAHLAPPNYDKLVKHSKPWAKTLTENSLSSPPEGYVFTSLRQMVELKPFTTLTNPEDLARLLLLRSQFYNLSAETLSVLASHKNTLDFWEEPHHELLPSDFNYWHDAPFIFLAQCFYVLGANRGKSIVEEKLALEDLFATVFTREWFTKLSKKQGIISSDSWGYIANQKELRYNFRRLQPTTLALLNLISIDKTLGVVPSFMVDELLTRYEAIAKLFTFEAYQTSTHATTPYATDYNRYHTGEALFTFALAGREDLVFNDDWLINLDPYGRALGENPLNEWHVYGFPKRNEPTLEVVALRLLLQESDPLTVKKIYSDFLLANAPLTSFVAYVLSYSKYRNIPVAWYLALENPQEGEA